MLSDGEGVYHPPSSGSFLTPYLPLINEAREKGIMHFGHEHPLTFMEEVRNGFEDEDVLYCNGCGIEIGRSGFRCCMEKCYGFNLHEVCASLPKEMKDYPQHPQHPLILCTGGCFSCDVCKAYYPSVPWSFHYRCKACDFDVDLRCAFMSFLVCPRTLHNHELTPQLHPASFLCSFCGEKHGEFGTSYQCKTCWFWIHEQCYSLPQSIEHDSHVHSLKLCHIQEEDLPECLCGVCEEHITNKHLGFYLCKNCKYYVHINCSTKKWDPIIETIEEEDQINDKLIQFPLPSIEVVHNTLAQFIKNICQWKEKEDKNGNILNHPSHDHPLTLEFDLSKFTNFNYEVCNGCMLPLLNDAPFYSCNRSTCNFLLHKWCAKLPRELKHPAHTDKGHTLILQEKVDECFGFFTCNGCQRVGNGFAYKCNVCKSYYLDVKCAALPKLVNYETHKHPLLLKYGRSIGGCFSCGDTNFFEEKKKYSWEYNYGPTISKCPTSFTFGCDRCHFSIHPRCLILPQEIVYWYDKHGFKLTESIKVFTSDDNKGASAYHCEFCEEEVNEEQWMYHCFECDQCVDINCVRELFCLFSNPVKFGGLYDYSLHKKHPLTCILVEEGFTCDHCNGMSFCWIFGIGFECKECQIMFGLTCFLKGIVSL